jgi:hypothetical protein
MLPHSKSVIRFTGMKLRNTWAMLRRLFPNQSSCRKIDPRVVPCGDKVELALYPTWNGLVDLDSMISPIGNCS